MNFTEAMRFVERERQFPTDRLRMHGERFAALLHAVPELEGLREVPAVVVAGSAGKGSTARFVAALARALLDQADPRPVVLGTKPPLRETDDGHRERYQRLEHGAANGAWIERDRFAAHVSVLAPHVMQLESSLGSFAPYDVRYGVLAMEAVASNAALVVVEANIGLRNDVSRQWPNVRALGLSRFGVEHASLLSLPDPAPPLLAGLGPSAGPVWHKAGGVWPGLHVAIGVQSDPRILEVAERLAMQEGASEIAIAGRDFAIDDALCSMLGTGAKIRVGSRSWPIALEVLGGFQLENAALAIELAHLLQRDGALPGDLSALAHASSRLSAVRIPGRMEIVSRNPLAIRNVTEAPTKAASLLSCLEELGAHSFIVVATAIARVEGAREVIERLASAPQTRLFVATAFHAHADQRDADPRVLASWAGHARPDLNVVSIPDAGAAIQCALRAATDGDVVLLVGDGLANAWEAQNLGG